jgi:hypothetical protein
VRFQAVAISADGQAVATLGELPQQAIAYWDMRCAAKLASFAPPALSLVDPALADALPGGGEFQRGRLWGLLFHPDDRTLLYALSARELSVFTLRLSFAGPELRPR